MPRQLRPLAQPSEPIALFADDRARCRPLHRRPFAKEADLRRFAERRLEPALGLRIVATEVRFAHPTPGRIDALAVDADLQPVVIEFKRAPTGRAIWQCLLYRTWLETHREAVALRVAGRFGLALANQLKWTKPRTLCIVGTLDAGEESAARQLQGRVEVIQIIRYADALFAIRVIS
jgi:hypothetical protein